MRRLAPIILGSLVLVWGVLALALGSASLRLGSARRQRAQSPACLPSTLAHSSALPGTGLDVSPEPGSDTANPRTQISFLGVPARDISRVSVVGSRSGGHAGRLLGYSQGDGASFVPSTPFRAGEHVSVRAQVSAGASARAVRFGFSVDTPIATASISQFPNPAAPPSDYQSFYTMPGAQAPIMSVTVPDRDPRAGDILTTNGPGPGQYGPLIYTPAGRLVWFDRLPPGEVAEDLSEQTYRGRRELTWWRGRVLSLGFGVGEDLVMNDRYQVIARITGGNGLSADLHELQLGPRDIAYISAYNPVRCDLLALKGSPRGAIVDAAIQEIDMNTGLVRWEWHALDHVGASESEVEVPHDTSPWDYFHLNAIDPEPNGDLLITARSTWAAYQLQSGSGAILWRLGGNRSSFAMGPGTRVAWEHDGRMLANGQVTFFDDGSNPPIHPQSRAVRIALDLRAHRARLLASITHPGAPLLAASQGNVQTLPDGNVVVGYGGVPEISEYAPDGTLLFDAHQPFDMAFYRAFRFPWRGQPLTPPAVLASLNDTGEETIVHASWNGATEVAAWRILAGADRRSLAARATIPAAAFESSTTLTNAFKYVAVQALDSSGRTLSTSSVPVIGYAAALRAAP